MASKTRRRGAGDGALYQDARGLWCAAVSLTPGPDGKRRRKVVRSRTRAGAAEKLRAMRAELDRVGDLPTSSPTLAQWLTSWLAVRARTMKPTAWDSYSGHVHRYITPAIGRYRLDQLTPDHVRRLHAYIADDLGLSSATQQGAHGVLHEALKAAMREGRTARNVAELVDRPRRAVSQRTALTATQARTLLSTHAADPASVHWWIALLLGMRQGERLGITRDAVDLDAGTITVSWQLQRLRWRHRCQPPQAEPPARGQRWPCGALRGVACPERSIAIPEHHEAVRVVDALWLTRPKTRTGWREVPMPPGLVEVLRRHIETTPPGLAGLVLHRGDGQGRPIEPDQDRKAWHRALAAAGLPAVPLHSARHTTATLLRTLGTPADVRMQILGHADEATTAGYTHLSKDEAVEAMARYEALLAPGEGSAGP